MKKDDCIFCKLANGEIPTRSIYEDEDFKVILDTAPATRGHALILPKEHADNLYQLPEEMTGRAFVLAKKMAASMTKTVECQGFNIVQNNGEAAGQTVFHFHIHIIPRYEGGPEMVAWEPCKPTAEELAETAEKIREAL